MQLPCVQRAVAARASSPCSLCAPSGPRLRLSGNGDRKLHLPACPAASARPAGSCSPGAASPCEPSRCCRACAAGSLPGSLSAALARGAPRPLGSRRGRWGGGGLRGPGAGPGARQGPGAAGRGCEGLPAPGVEGAARGGRPRAAPRRGAACVVLRGAQRPWVRAPRAGFPSGGAGCGEQVRC